MNYLFQYSVLVVLNLLFRLFNAQKCSYNQNFDINGENLGVKLASSTFDQCCGLCAKNSQCQAWSFYRSLCQLKYKVPTGVAAYAKTCVNGCL